MTTYIGGQGPRCFEAAIRRWFEKGRPDSKVPAWTEEDLENLRRRVQRIAAQSER